MIEFKKEVLLFLDTTKVTRRVLHALEHFNINTNEALHAVLQEQNEILKVNAFGPKTIIDLQSLYSFVIKRQGLDNTSQVETKIIEQQQKHQFFSNIRDEMLKSNFLKDLKAENNIDNVFLSHLNYFFPEIKHASLGILKLELGLKLEGKELQSVSKITEERKRQIGIKLSQYIMETKNPRLEPLFECFPINFHIEKQYCFLSDVIVSNNEMIRNLFIILYAQKNSQHEYVSGFIQKDTRLFKVNPLLLKSSLLTKQELAILKKELKALSICKVKRKVDLEQLLKRKLTPAIDNFINDLCKENRVDIKCLDRVVSNNGSESIQNLIEECLRYFNQAVTIQSIYRYLLERYPDRHFNITTIRATLSREKNRFQLFGKTGRYSINRQAGTEGFQSIRSLALEVMDKRDSPIHMSELVGNLIHKYPHLKAESIKEIVRATPEITGLGQSFYINSKTKAEAPLHHKKADRIIRAFINERQLHMFWVLESDIYNYFRRCEIPLYQQQYIRNHYFFHEGSKSTTPFQLADISKLVQILNDSKIHCLILSRYIHSPLPVKIQIRQNVKRYLANKYLIQISQEDLQKMISYHF